MSEQTISLMVWTLFLSFLVYFVLRVWKWITRG